MTFKCDRCGKCVYGNFYMIAFKCVDVDRLHTRDDFSMINNSVLCFECSLEFEYEIRHLFEDEQYLQTIKEAKESEKKLTDAFYRYRHTKFWRDKIEANDRAIKLLEKKFDEKIEKEDSEK